MTWTPPDFSENKYPPQVYTTRYHVLKKKRVMGKWGSYESDGKTTPFHTYNLGLRCTRWWKNKPKDDTLIVSRWHAWCTLTWPRLNITVGMTDLDGCYYLLLTTCFDIAYELESTAPMERGDRGDVWLWTLHTYGFSNRDNMHLASRYTDFVLPEIRWQAYSRSILLHVQSRTEQARRQRWARIESYKRELKSRGPVLVPFTRPRGRPSKRTLQ